MKEIYIGTETVLERIWGWMPLWLGITIGFAIGCAACTVHDLFYIDAHKIEFCQKVLGEKK